ncbi:MAG: septation protein A [Gammaproteobacteria bacterium]|nr:MAG: septation protein A [Gammaproteobacteria bacterium]
MKTILEFSPIILFFIVYKLSDIYYATAALMISYAALVLVMWLSKRKVEKIHVISLIALLIFGGMTLTFKDPLFIKWKPTVVNFILGSVFLVSPLMKSVNIAERMMGSVFDLSQELWQKVNLSWIIFFFVSGLLNIIVAYTCEESTWVNFKLFGLTGIGIIFMAGLFLSLRKYI